MSTYRIVFANGEKKELIVDADDFKETTSSTVFYKDKHKVAAVPMDKILYIVEVEG